MHKVYIVTGESLTRQTGNTPGKPLAFSTPLEAQTKVSEEFEKWRAKYADTIVDEMKPSSTGAYFTTKNDNEFFSWDISEVVVDDRSHDCMD